LLLANQAKASREPLTLIRIFEELRGRGYDRSYDAVRRYAKPSENSISIWQMCAVRAWRHHRYKSWLSTIFDIIFFRSN
jgi:hypothetical protein